MRTFYPYTKGYRQWILLGVACSIAEAVLELELPQAMSDIVDVGIASGDRRYIMLMGLKMLVLALLALAGGVGAAVFAAKASMGFGAQVRQAEYEQVQRFSFANIEHFSTASLITRLTNDGGLGADDAVHGHAHVRPGSGDADYRHHQGHGDQP